MWGMNENREKRLVMSLSEMWGQFHNGKREATVGRTAGIED